MEQIYLAIPLAPLLGAIIAGLFGKAIGRVVFQHASGARKRQRAACQQEFFGVAQRVAVRVVKSLLVLRIFRRFDRLSILQRSVQALQRRTCVVQLLLGQASLQVIGFMPVPD